MTQRRQASWAAAAIAVAALCGCGGSDGLAPGMPENVDMSKISDPMANSQVKSIGKPAKKDR